MHHPYETMKDLGPEASLSDQITKVMKKTSRDHNLGANFEDN